MRAYRTPRWKLVRDFLNAGRDELYDLRADLAESKNLIDDRDPELARVVADLDGRIRERMRGLGDAVLGEAAPPVRPWSARREP